jgi:hypothetical protein
MLRVNYLTTEIVPDVKSQLFNYRDCAPEAVRGTYDKTKHVASIHIHPVIAALFIPKCQYLERRMLMTNIARMVILRGQAYLKNVNFAQHVNFVPGELDAEFELAYDIAHDPNSLDHFKDDTPMDNMLKRFRCQIELYKCVLNLRQGRYYSRGYDETDGISGFLKIINSYNWTFFDSPDMFHYQDEGTVLRKLLAVFSCRPTFTRLSSVVPVRGVLGHTGIGGMGKTVFVNIPIINIKLPIDLSGRRRYQVSLSNSLRQTDYFIENKTIVPKNKEIIYSNQVAFFYANRRYPTVNFQNLQMGVRCVSLPMSLTNTTAINKAQINFNNRMRIGRDLYDLSSVVYLQRPTISGIDLGVGCSAGISLHKSSYGPTNRYLHYDPSVASIEYRTGGGAYTSRDPITHIPVVATGPNTIGFRTEAQERGTVFFYCREPRRV